MLRHSVVMTPWSRGVLALLLGVCLASAGLQAPRPAYAAGAVSTIYSGSLASGGRLVFTVSDASEILGMIATGPLGGDCKMPALDTVNGPIGTVVDGSFTMTNRTSLAFSGSLAPDGHASGTWRFNSPDQPKCDSGEQSWTADVVPMVPASAGGTTGAGDKWAVTLSGQRSAMSLPTEPSRGFGSSSPGSVSAKPGFFLFAVDLDLGYVSPSQADVVSTFDAVLVREDGSISRSDGFAATYAGPDKPLYQFGGGQMMATKNGRSNLTLVWALPHQSVGQPLYVLYFGGPALPVSPAMPA